MTNKGATVKLTEKQRETLDRLAGYLGHEYVGLSFVRPNTWRSLVAAGLVQESATERGMFRLTDEGCAAAGVKPTYVSNVRSAECFAVIEHLRRVNDAAMHTALAAAQLRDSQVLIDPHLKRIAAVGTELVNGRTRLWTVDLDEPDQSPKWVDATPEMMNVVFARAEGRPAPVYMRRSDSGLLFRVLGSDAEGVNLVAESDERYELHRDLDALIEDDWIATDHEGVGQARQALRSWVAGANNALAKTVAQLTAGCPAGSACTGAAFPGHPAHALEGVLEKDDCHLVGEVPRAKPVRLGIDSSYWVVPLVGQRLTDRHDVLGPYATRCLAEHKQQEYADASYPCRVVSSVTRPVPFAVGEQVRQLDGATAEVFEVVGETVFARTVDGEVWEHEADELERADAVPSAPRADPRGRPKTPAELAEDKRGLERMFDEARQKSTDPVVREFYGVDAPQEGEHDSSCADGCTHQHRSTGQRVVTMTLAEYIASVAVTVSAARRAAMLQERAGC